MQTSDRTGQIVPFPHRSTLEAEADLQLRLRQAIVKLNEALTAQNSAVAAWRGSADDLNARVAHLAETAAGFQQALEALSAEMVQLRERSRRLADGASLS